LKMPIPSALVTRFFQLLVNRQFTEAERELERLKQRMQKTEWNRGYFRALYGMFLSRKANGDSYAFLPRLDLDDKAALHGYKREFLDHVRNRLHRDFDRGFFSAWADCMRVLSRITVPHVASSTETNGIVSEGEKLETVKADNGQATIENFLEDQGED
jgi:hypothetical protein